MHSEAREMELQGWTPWDSFQESWDSTQAFEGVKRGWLERGKGEGERCRLLRWLERAR